MGRLGRFSGHSSPQHVELARPLAEGAGLGVHHHVSIVAGPRAETIADVAGLRAGFWLLGW